MLDRLVGDRPAYLRRYDGHMALANSAALKLAGITANTPNPAGGVIDRLDDGKTPSGILRDNAMALLEKVVPEPSDDEIREAIQAAMKAAAAVGITSIQDMEGSPPAVRAKLIRALHKLAEADKLDVRINLHWPIALQKQLADVGIAANFGNDFLRLGGVKGYMDGSLGSSTAKMFDPYASDKTTTGVFVTEPDAMRALVRSATDSGLLVAIHAIGDRANAEVLTIFEDLAARPGAGRFRIEHVQHLRVEDYPRFKKANVVASMQPYHIVDDGRWAEGRIGTKRCASSYAYRSLLDQGTRLAFGSDWPVAPLNPFLGIEAAVLRQTLDGKNPRGWFPEQAITVEEALKAYTTGSAYAAGQELERGLIKPGFLGDLVILQQDILDPNLRGKLGSILPKMTLLGGRVVSESKD
jgi:predicted amidohydrolase YtcJ